MSCFSFPGKTKHHAARVCVIPTNMGVQAASARVCDSVKNPFYGITNVLPKPCFQRQKTRQWLPYGASSPWSHVQKLSDQQDTVGETARKDSPRSSCSRAASLTWAIRADVLCMRGQLLWLSLVLSLSSDGEMEIFLKLKTLRWPLPQAEGLRLGNAEEHEMVISLFERIF